MDSKNMGSLMTGAAAAMAVGTAAYLMSTAPKSRKKQLKKKAGQAVQAVGEVVDGISSMMK